MKTITLDKPVRRDTAARPKSATTLKTPVTVRRILVPIDFSKPSLVAIDYASRVATRFGAELNLIHVFEPPTPFVGMNGLPIYLPNPEAEINARDTLEKAAKRHGIPLRAEHVHIKEGRPFEEICRLASKLQIDLIIIPTRGNTGLKHLTVGSTAERVIRYSPCPVLVLRSDAKTSGNGKLPAASIRFRKIVAPTDFSECSMKGLGYAMGLAEKFGSTLILLHAVHPQYYVTNPEYARYDFGDYVERAEDFAEEELNHLLKRTQSEGVNVRASFQIGHPGDQICTQAKAEGADLIVTATHGRTGLQHVFVGSTAEFVVRHAHCPVLVVPTRATPMMS
jgi:nucleotide-binding universal stress UspA family protein